jgi:hypothetical protein
MPQQYFQAIGSTELEIAAPENAARYGTDNTYSNLGLIHRWFLHAVDYIKLA